MFYTRPHKYMVVAEGYRVIQPGCSCGWRGSLCETVKEAQEEHAMHMTLRSIRVR